jgi:hypothetical protein
MNVKASARAQRGASLVVGLIMLVLVTVMVSSNFTLSTTNLKAVGNMQLRDEAIAAANKAIEQVIGTPFTDAPTEDEILVDIDNDGSTDYRVIVDIPTCVQADPFIISSAAPSSIALGSAFAIAGSTFYQTIWDLNATVTDDATGTSVSVREGVRTLLTQAEYNAVCL